MNKWTLTSDKQPRRGERVLLALVRGAWDTKPTIEIGYLWVDGYMVKGYKDMKSKREVVAWMPLPELPPVPCWEEKENE